MFPQQLQPKVFAGIAAKTSAMFLSLPVKACLEEMSSCYPCREPSASGLHMHSEEEEGGEEGEEGEGGRGAMAFRHFLFFFLPKFCWQNFRRDMEGNKASTSIGSHAEKVYFNSYVCYKLINFC